MSTIEKHINVARGLEKADLVIKNAKLVNVLSEEIYETDIAICQDTIVGLGTNYKGLKTIDAKGCYVCPSFIDGHIHLESSMLLPKEFTKAVLGTGTTTVVTDPHEIANVYGLDGINFMYNATRNLPLNVYFTLSSCVPATSFETSGYTLTAKELSKLIDNPWIVGLAEMMNDVGVINLDKTVIDKINLARSYNKVIDGHSPLLNGKDLCAYVTSGVQSDHECTLVKEAKEKLRLGMYIMIREGTAAKNLDALLPILKACNTRRCCFVTDDRYPTDLKEHINGMVRRAVKYGISPIKAIQCASLNTAKYFGLNNIGAIAPNYKADLLILPDLKSFKPKTVIKDGKIVVNNGKLLININKTVTPKYKPSINVKDITQKSFEINLSKDTVKTIEIIPTQLLTNAINSKINLVNGKALSNIKNDTLKICVIERHHKTGNIGKGFIKGFNLKSGAIASTVAHDSHNIIVIGTNDKDMYIATKALIKSQGGKVVVNNGKVVAHLPLPIAGLISNRDIDFVTKQYNNLTKSVKKLGCNLKDPFMTMAFVSLSVIPELKITDKGLFDAVKFEFTSL